MVKAGPAAALIVAEPEFLLEFLIIALDEPSQLGEIDEALDRGLGGEVGEPVLCRFVCAQGPLDEQPMRQVRWFAPADGRVDSEGGKARAQGRGAALTPSHRPLARARERLGERRNLRGFPTATLGPFCRPDWFAPRVRRSPSGQTVALPCAPTI